MVDYVGGSEKVGFLNALILFYFSVSVIVLCILNWTFNIVLLGGIFFLVLALITGRVACREVRRSRKFRKRIFSIFLMDLLVSILTVFVFPLFFIAKVILFLIFSGVILDHEVSSVS